MEDKKAYITIIEAEKLAENLFFTVGNDGISCKDSFLKGYKAALKPASESKFASDFAEWLSKNYIPEYVIEVDGVYWFKKSDFTIFSNYEQLSTSELQQEFLKTYKG